MTDDVVLSFDIGLLGSACLSSSLHPNCLLLFDLRGCELTPWSNNTINQSFRQRTEKPLRKP
jgi:hypothetical protein